MQEWHINSICSLAYHLESSWNTIFVSSKGLDKGKYYRVFLTFSTSSSNAHCTPSLVLALASMKSIWCLRANLSPSSRLTSRLSCYQTERKEILWVKTYGTVEHRICSNLSKYNSVKTHKRIHCANWEEENNMGE